MKYVFRVGDRGVGSPDLPPGFANKPFTVTGGREWRKFWDHDPNYYMSYMVEFDHDKKGSYPLKAHAARLPPPKRGDMDQKAGWAMLPLAVVQAMKGEKNNG